MALASLWLAMGPRGRVENIRLAATETLQIAAGDEERDALIAFIRQETETLRYVMNRDIRPLRIALWIVQLGALLLVVMLVLSVLVPDWRLATNGPAAIFLFVTLTSLTWFFLAALSQLRIRKKSREGGGHDDERRDSRRAQAEAGTDPFQGATS